MQEQRKQAIIELLKGIETGNPESVKVVNEQQYIQHNPLTREGDVGLAELFARLAKTNPSVSIMRIFADGDYVFAHTEYDFSSEKICFEVFRFEGEQTVEHWDNLQLKQAPNHSGHTMTDGDTQVRDADKTEANRQRINQFVQQVLIDNRVDNLEQWFDARRFREHNPLMGDNIQFLAKALTEPDNNTQAMVRYEKHHKTLAEGNFVLSICEGSKAGHPTSFYDLYRLENNLILEHWDTTEIIPPRSHWANENGKF